MKLTNEKRLGNVRVYNPAQAKAYIGALGDIRDDEGKGTPARTNMSAAKLWYKLDEAAAPLINSGSGGPHDLAYDALNSNGQATFHDATGLFGNCMNFTSAHNHCGYLLRTDDSAWNGANMTLWWWVKPIADFSAHNQWGWGHYVWNGGNGFYMEVTNTSAFYLNYSGTFGNNHVQSADNAITYALPHLLAATYDGANLTGYIDGAPVINLGLVGTMQLDPGGDWTLGCRTDVSAYHVPGQYMECGFNTTTFTAAQLLAMYHKGNP